MAKYDWMEYRLAEQEELVANHTPKCPAKSTLERTPEENLTKLQYLDWTYGMTSKRFKRHLDAWSDLVIDRGYLI